MTRDAIPPEIAQALSATVDERGVFGRTLHYFPEVTSTNTLAAEAAEQGAPEGTTFVAGSQTAGRGRLGRAWFSPPDAGLYVSTIVRRRAAAPWITLAAGVAAAEGIRAATALPVQIKWPNDIVAVDGRGFKSRRKLAGILAEASSGPQGLQYIVIGVGINVQPASFPPDLADRASSLETELGRPVDRGLVLASLLAGLREALSHVERGDVPGLLARWRQLAPSAEGAAVEWDDAGMVRRGVTAGLDAEGALLVREAGTQHRIISGEIRWI